MKVIEAIKQSNKPFFSLEILPPAKGEGITTLYRALDPVMEFAPHFINVTYHQPHIRFVETEEGIQKIYHSKRPGTVGICAAVKYKYGVETVPHIICGGFTRYETEDALIDLHYLGLKNVFAVRGDPPPGMDQFVPEKEGHHYAYQLVQQISDMNRGIYLENLRNQCQTDFCIGVAAYPEKHAESPNREADLRNLRKKVEAGAEYAITQMFFDVKKYTDFVKFLRNEGIDIPVIPGIKPLTSLKQVYSIPKKFHVDIPAELVRKMEECRTDHEIRKAGIFHTIRMIEELVDFGVPAIHIFSMSHTGPVVEILRETGGLLR